MARAGFDLAIVSVLLDAGAGPQWRYEEGRTGKTHTRSEGLAVASFDMFIGGVFSSRPEDPYRVDAGALMALTARELAAGFQVSRDNPLVGVENRAALLNRLGRGCHRPRCLRPRGRSAPRRALRRDRRDGGGERGRQGCGDPGSDPGPSRRHLAGAHRPRRRRSRRHLAAPAGPGSRRHERPRAVPQALAMALLLAHRAARMGRLHGGGRGRVDGAAEYRNGGLFLDTGVIALKDPDDPDWRMRSIPPLVVEWRALTVALLDRIAVPIRSKLGLAARTSPSRRCWKAAPGRPGGGSRRSGAGTARRRSRSSATGRFSEAHEQALGSQL